MDWLVVKLEVLAQAKFEPGKMLPDRPARMLSMRRQVNRLMIVLLSHLLTTGSQAMG
jgi:hypothetical protein